nr:DUF2946 family protein [Solimonas marina]
MTYLGVFALIGQLLLPSIHAQSLAQRMGNPLYAAFCGEVAPQRLAALQRQLHTSLQQSDERAATQQPQMKAGCPLCGTIHAGQFAVPSIFALPLLPRAAAPAHVLAGAIRRARARLWLPPPRGPPIHS